MQVHFWTIISNLFLVRGLAPFYIDSSQQFLKDYGAHYNLFSRFFDDFNFSTPKESKHYGIASPYYNEFRVRNYSLHEVSQGSADPGKFLNNASFYGNTSLVNYNNRFRYGSKPQDRFMSIFFHKDPWLDDDSTVNFVGGDTDIVNKRFFCNFTFPVHARSEVVIKRDIFNAFLQLTKENMVYCPIPTILKLALAESISQVSLNFIVEHGKGIESILLSNVTVYRDHPLDRRSFFTSMCTMLDDLDDPMVIEWLTYNSLLGVEHFYIFDNTKRTVNLYKSALRPFLDANLVTIIYYPYVPVVGQHWSLIQRTTFQVFLQRYGHLNKWVSFSDVDEFFFPSDNRKPKNLLDFANYISNYLHAIDWPSDKMPGVMYNTKEMGCIDPHNLYGSKTPHRQAVSTHCNLGGLLIEEQVGGHGKMFIKPEKVNYLVSPHRLNDYWVTWGTPADGGLFFHFDNFKYGEEGMAPNIKKNPDLRLQQFTIMALSSIGVNQTDKRSADSIQLLQRRRSLRSRRANFIK